MNTQEICLILENVSPTNFGYGRISENTEFLAQIGYVKIQHIEAVHLQYHLDEERKYYFGKLTDKGIKYLKQNKPESDYFKLNAPS